MNLTSVGERMVGMPSAVLLALDFDSAEGALPVGEGREGVRGKATLGKGRTGAELRGPS